MKLVEDKLVNFSRSDLVTKELDEIKSLIFNLSSTNKKNFCLKSDLTMEIERIDKKANLLYATKESIEEVKEQALIDKDKFEAQINKHSGSIFQHSRQI